MPLPDDENLVKTATELISTMQEIYGKHPGCRPGHAKGIILSGTFTPTPEASALSCAPHFSAPSTPVWARFSNNTGLPQIPDNIPDASPHGFALRFHLGDRKHTDILTHSSPYFPVRTGEGLLRLFQAVAASPPGAESPTAMEKFLGATPSALRFVMAEKPIFAGYATGKYWGINAYKLIPSPPPSASTTTSTTLKPTFVKYQFHPLSHPLTHLTPDALALLTPNHLQETLPTSLPITFTLVAQIALEGDVLDDATEQWPDDRELVTLGTVVLDAILEEQEKVSKEVIFDPVPRVEGVEGGGDPMLEFRAAVYLVSGRERRAA